MGCGFCEATLSNLVGGIFYLTSFIITLILQLLNASAYFLLGKIKTNNLINTVRPAKPKVI